MCGRKKLIGLCANHFCSAMTTVQNQYHQHGSFPSEPQLVTFLDLVHLASSLSVFLLQLIENRTFADKGHKII